MTPGDPFRLDDWRAGIAGRRELGRLAILEGVRIGSIETVIRRLKLEIGFDGMDDRDKNVFNVMASNLRRIAEGWSRLDDRTRHGFSCGVLPYSAVHKIVTAPDFRGRAKPEPSR